MFSKIRSHNYSVRKTGGYVYSASKAVRYSARKTLGLCYKYFKIVLKVLVLERLRNAVETSGKQ